MSKARSSAGKRGRSGPGARKAGVPSPFLVNLVRFALLVLLVLVGTMKWKAKHAPSPKPSAPVPPIMTDGVSAPYISQKFSFEIDGVKTKRGFTGWGDAPKLNETIMGGPLRVKGVNYDKGIGSQAASEIVFDLGGRVRRFSCLAGVDEKGGDSASLVFAVKVDNKKVFQSPVMRRDNEAVIIDVDVTGAKELSLILDPDGNPDWDHGDWINLRFKR